MPSFEGILPVNKPIGKTSFNLVSSLRKLTNIKTIGHAGTLDPFASGVMILLIGKPYTKLSSSFLNQDKQYLATLHLGITTDSYDLDGQITAQSPLIPAESQIEKALLEFQGTIDQIPPMFSAKKVQGKKLYDLARKGIIIPRAAIKVTIKIELISYIYPYIQLKVDCSKGTYIRSLAHDIGTLLGSGAHLSQLNRTKSGHFQLTHCCDGERLFEKGYNWFDYLQKTSL
ncbi:tRNA pseudouridine(55) synthase TruB [Candidatus Rhabdochlamydia porcellionis]|jgi:tRNA pseudouridine55 synthase|uniref:tRNA pseudouridine synthase B n=1 Tax=Candidatus Rhabdochlamydia porcellionis TaxID=225148 RepID=A0ABX8Z4N0_9BACT|nr:tRNA pseudouridine(55) synthase TruB [Candidatus Rhabdochlamydia porcellionis]QZA59051.1 tRNA pseudouridine synthase B [Candidatus Rhabdochlamydia porcellionis]